MNKVVARLYANFKNHISLQKVKQTVETTLGHRDDLDL